MDFDNVLDACLDALRAGDSIDECLSRYPGHAEQLKPLLHTAAMLRDAAPARLSADAFGHGRTALQMAARDHQRRRQAPTVSAHTAQHRPPPRGRPAAAAPIGPRRRFALFPSLATAAAALILVLATALLLSTARASLPGQTLYGAKRVVESVQGRLMQAAGQGPAWQARQLERRVQELATLHAVGMPVDAAIYDEVKEQIDTTLAAADTLPDDEQVALLAAVRDQLSEVQGHMLIDEPPALAVGRAIGALDMALAGQGTPAVALAAAVSTPAAADVPAPEPGAADSQASGPAAPADATAVQSTIARATATRGSGVQASDIGATATAVSPTPAAVAALLPTAEAPVNDPAARAGAVALAPFDAAQASPSPVGAPDPPTGTPTPASQPSARAAGAPMPAVSPMAPEVAALQAMALAVSTAITQPVEGGEVSAVATPAVATLATVTETDSLTATLVAMESPAAAATATATVTATLVATPTLGGTPPEPAETLEPAALPTVTAEPAATADPSATPAPEPPILEPTPTPEATATAVVADDPAPAPPADEVQATATPDARRDSAPVGVPSQDAGETPEVLPSAEPVTD